MDKVRELMDNMGILPKLRLGIQLPKGGVKSTGPHRVKFLTDMEGITKKDFEGKPSKMLRFTVEEEGTKFWWYVKVLNKEGQPNYLLERVAEIQIGDERILEMTKKGIINYIDIREVDAPPTRPSAGEVDDESEDDEEDE